MNSKTKNLRDLDELEKPGQSVSVADYSIEKSTISGLVWLGILARCRR